MNQSRKELISKLAGDANNHKVSAVKPIYISGLLFALAVIGLSALFMYTRQPFRPQLISQLSSASLFPLEFASGLISILLLVFAAYRSVTPGEKITPLLFAIPLYLIWLLIIMSGFIQPVLPVSMDGKREQCYLEAVFYSSSIAVLISFLLRRRWPLKPVLTAFIAALVASTVPAFLMQSYCMHDAHHALTHHLLPMFLSAVVLTPIIYILITVKPARNLKGPYRE